MEDTEVLKLLVAAITEERERHEARNIKLKRLLERAVHEISWRVENGEPTKSTDLLVNEIKTVLGRK